MTGNTPKLDIAFIANIHAYVSKMICNIPNLDLVSLMHIQNLVKFYQFVLKILRRTILWRRQTLWGTTHIQFIPSLSKRGYYYMEERLFHTLYMTLQNKILGVWEAVSRLGLMHNYTPVTGSQILQSLNLFINTPTSVFPVILRQLSMSLNIRDKSWIAKMYMPLLLAC